MVIAFACAQRRLLQGNKKAMTVFLNQKEFTLPDAPAPSVADLLRTAGITSTTGVAVAVNNAVVRRADRTSVLLSEGDRVVVITAVCGG